MVNSSTDGSPRYNVVTLLSLDDVGVDKFDARLFTHHRRVLVGFFPKNLKDNVDVANLIKMVDLIPVLVGF